MTSYGKPRWPHPVLFGSFKDLNYRLDLRGGGENLFCLRTHSGPGFRLELVREKEPPGFQAKGYISRSARSSWLDDPKCREAAAQLLETHFSRVLTRPQTIECYCFPDREDILPEGRQLSWCLSRVYILWSAIPEKNRRQLRKADFIE